MTQIVHWKNIVGEDNLDTFTKMQKAIIFAERSGQTEADVFAKMKDREDDIAMWKEKRSLMRFCGYDAHGKRIGWYKAYLDGGELKFKTTAHEGRVYVSLSKFLDMKRLRQQDADEADYYGETQKIIKELSQGRPTNGDRRQKQYHVKHRADADLDGFIPEVD